MSALTPQSSRSRTARRGLTLVEVLIGLTIFGLVMTAVTRQLIEGVTVTLKTSRLLEYSRNGRNLIEQLSQDLRTAQSITIYPEFNDRSTTVAAGSSGNYVTLHQISGTGTSLRTVGYYLVPNGATGTFKLYRHDSSTGDSAAGALPDAATSGSHRVLVSTLKLPASTNLFTNWLGRGVTIQGQFGSAEGAPTARLNYIQCTLTTRS